MLPARISICLSSMIDKKNVNPIGLGFLKSSSYYQNFSPMGFSQKTKYQDII